MATVIIPKKIEQKLKTTSRKLGISKEDFLVNATLYYYKSLREKLSLRKELDVWEQSSDKDLLKFEETL